jgi:hypothetical protein
MPDDERVDSESLPMTEPYVPTFDTGALQQPEPAASEKVSAPEPPAGRRRWWHRRSNHSAPQVTEQVADEPTSMRIPAAPMGEVATSGTLPAPAPSITVPGRYYFLKWWQFLLVVIAVWIPAGGIGAGLFYWWSHDHSAHKTPVVFVVFVYVVVSTVAALMLAMVSDRPLVSAVAIALMSAVFASVVAAAPLYGARYCDHSQRHCLMGVIPY